MRHPASPRSALHRLLAATLATWLALLALSPATVAQTPPPLDIAAILLTPADLDAAAMPGFGVDSGATFTTTKGAIAVDTYAVSRGSVRLRNVSNISPILQNAGWQRMQETVLARPYPDDPQHFDFAVSSGVEVYGTPDGAAWAYQQLARREVISQMLYGDVQPAGTGMPLGDQASTWRNAQPAAGNDGIGSISISRWVQVGRNIVSVTLTDFADGDNATDPDAAQLDRLTTVVLDRLAAATAAGSGVCGTGGPAPADSVMTRLLGRLGATPATLALPGLSSCVQHLDEAETIAYFSQYRVLGGVAIPSRGETPTELADQQADASARGIVASYIEEQGIAASSQAPNGTEADVIVFLDLYTDAAAAQTSFAGTRDRMAARGSDILSFETGTLPDGTGVIRYTVADGNPGTVFTTTAAVVGNVIITARVGNTTSPQPGVTDALLASQLACIAAGGCPQPIPVPPALT